MMSQVIRQEAIVFLTAVLHGILLTFFYDLLRAVRRVFVHSLAAVSAEDFLFWAAAGFLTFCLLFQKTDGVIRGYVAVGAALGTAIYLSVFSRFVLWVVTGILGGIRTAVRMVGKAIGKIRRAVRKILGKIVGKVRRIIGGIIRKIVGKVRRIVGGIIRKIVGKVRRIVGGIMRKTVGRALQGIRRMLRAAARSFASRISRGKKLLKKRKSTAGRKQNGTSR